MEGIADNGQVASRLEGELGTLIGGERAREYLTRVETELAAVLTPGGQEKKGGPLRNAREAVEVTQTELVEAKRLRDMTISIGAELRQVTDEIDRLSDAAGDETTTQQIEDTRSAMEAARHFADGLALLEAQQAQALETAQRADSRQSDYIVALVSFNDTTQQLTEAVAKQGEEAAKLKDIETQKANLRESVAEIETRLEEVSKLRARRETFARQTQRLDVLQKDMQHLRARLEQLTALEDEQARLTEQLSELPNISRADVEALRRASNELRQCEMELAAFSTHLYLDITQSGQGKITLDGEALQSGPVDLPGGKALVLEGIGQIWTARMKRKPPC